MLAYIFKLWSSWSKLPADSSASVQPRNQITRNAGSHFLTVTMEWNLDFKLQSQFTKKLVQGDPWTLAHPKSKWTERKSGKCPGSSSYSFTLRSRFQRHVLEHRRRHRWRRFFGFRMKGHTSHTNSKRSQFLRDMSDMATPRQVAQADWAREKMENITNTTELLRECTQVCSKSNEQRTHKLKQYLSGCMVNRGKFEFRRIKQHRV